MSSNLSVALIFLIFFSGNLCNPTTSRVQLAINEINSSSSPVIDNSGVQPLRDSSFYRQGMPETDDNEKKSYWPDQILSHSKQLPVDSPSISLQTGSKVSSENDIDDEEFIGNFLTFGGYSTPLQHSLNKISTLTRSRVKDNTLDLPKMIRVKL